MMDWLKRFFIRRRPERSVAEYLAAWRIVSLRNDVENKRAVLRLRLVRPAIANASFDTAIQIAWRYVGDMPPSDTNASILAFERAIDDLTGDNRFAELVQVATGGGIKEWLFYCSDARRFNEELNRLLAGHERYPIEISSTADPEWQIWRDTIESVRDKLAGSPTH